ncbi:replication-associated protein [Sewage-associated circular DNA virus-11]|uniref:replication-associated protein n=1 Tax=Sewage-associated circular DNA virus-11 TaxID=1519387 RepID=UPI0004D190F1|nr:replication-associated protein [Sewage-associated circular DNA virus-11]AIF34799.1 replication-associated protein [Sewage-associated circular DNA virus-11]
MATTTSSEQSNKSNRTKRLSRFVFTLNNYTAEEEQVIQLLGTTLKMKWLIYGREVGEKGTPHLQGAAVIGRQLAWKTIKNSFPPRTHLEEMKGTPRESFIYCTKEDKEYYQFGEEPKPGKRNDLLDAVASLRKTSSFRDFVKDDQNASVYVKYTRGLTAFRSLLREPRSPSRPPTVYWLHGPTGAGKTKHAWEFLEGYFGTDQETWISNGSLRWFDGYDGHRGVILDDIRADSVPYNELLRLLDRYPYRVEYKGGTTEWIPEIIIITAPMGPYQFFRVGDDIEQLLRRVNGGIFEFTIDGPNPRLQTVAPTVPNTPAHSEVESQDDVQELQESSEGLSLLESIGRGSGIEQDQSNSQEEETQLRKKRKFID